MFKAMNFSNGGYYHVWVENEEGAKIANFPCSSETFEKAKEYAELFIKSLNNR